MKTLGKLLVVVILLCTGFAAQAATTYYVATTGNDSNSGTSATQAKRTIQAAIDVAAMGDVVQVAAGTYLLDSAIVLKEGVNLRGASSVILDGQDKTRIIFQASNFSTNTLVEGLVIVHGFLEDKNARGAGAFLRSNVTLRSCSFRENKISAQLNSGAGSGKGAGLYLDSKDNRIENCTFESNGITNSFEENTYTAMGAGLYSSGGNTVVSSHFSQNEIINAGNGSSYGGGVYALSQTEINSCTINQNSITKTGALAGSVAQGGGVHLNSSMLKNSTISKNIVAYTAEESSDAASFASSDIGGGGVYANFSATVYKNNIGDNKFDYTVTLPSGKMLSVNRVGGGGLMCYSGNASRASIVSNAIYNNKFTETITGGVSVKNGGGGGIYASNVGHTTIDSCMVYSNAASGTNLGQGGGMYLTKMTMVNAVHTGNINAVRCDVR
ncbi:MAG: hypothetical protein LBU92_01410, partial [Prevotellaceae bacterium]|nr:hypothetical protein [Prevotellaceae bacterium]